MKNAAEFQKYYAQAAEESYQKWGYHYPPRNLQEFQNSNQQFYEKYLKDRPDGVKKTQAYLRLAETWNDFAWLLFFQQEDYAFLNDILYQTSRYQLLQESCRANGTDHCAALMTALCAFASNDWDILPSVFPAALVPAAGKYYTEISVHLLYAMLYPETTGMQAALAKAEAFLAKKSTGWERHTVLYFKALAQEDAAEASQHLQHLCAVYPKVQHSINPHYNKMKSCFAAEIHGMYRLCRHLRPALLPQIQQPQHPVFFNEFETWQHAQQYPQGKPVYPYPPEMDYLNRILRITPPAVQLHQPYPGKKDLYADTDRFLLELTEKMYEPG